MAFGVDYSMFPHPTTKDLSDAKVKFVCRYVSPEQANDANGKNLTPAECAELKAAKLEIVLVYEPSSPTWMLGGKTAGQDAAKDFDAVAKALGLDGVIMYCAADFDAASQQQTTINDCLTGAAEIIGLHRTGIYGGYYTVTRALQAGKATYAWQTPAWSGGQWSASDGIRQGFGMTIGGAPVDVDTSMGPDFGQWPRPSVPGSHGPYRHVVPDRYSLTIDELAHRRLTTVDHIVQVSNDYCNKIHKEILAGYMEMRAALVSISKPIPPLPAGLVYYTTNP